MPALLDGLHGKQHLRLMCLSGKLNSYKQEGLCFICSF